MADRAVKTDWSKYEVDDNGDFLTDDAGDFVEKIAPITPKSNLREDVTFLGSEKAGKTASAFFPRTAKAAGEGKGYGNQAGSAGLDLLSVLGRALSTEDNAEKARRNKEGAPTQDFDWRESLADTQGKGFVDKVIRDPGTGAALLAAPLTGGLSLGGMAGVGLRGGLTGAASAAAHQGENVIQGEGVSPGQTALEVALNALIPMGGKWVAPHLKNAGVSLLHKVIKPEKAVRKAGYSRPGDPMHGTRELLKAGRGGTLKSSLEQVEGRSETLNDLVEDILLQKSRKATVTSVGSAPKAAPGKTGVEATGRTVSEPAEDVIFSGTPGNPALAGLRALPESTVPAAPEVVRAGGPTAPALLERTRGTPSVMVTPAPRIGSQVPDVAVTPNLRPMPNQIDPRFVRPQATSTPNQPPIQDALQGEAYGIPSSRNLPQPYRAGGVPVSPEQARQEAVERLAEAVGATPAGQRLLGASAGKSAGQAPAGSTTRPQAAGQGRLPPGAPSPTETVTDITKIVDLLDALQGAKKGLGQEISGFEHAGLADDIGSGVSQWADDLAARGDGIATPLQALKYQRGVGKFGKFDYGQNPQLIPPKSRVANKYYEKIGDRLEEIAPEISPLRREQSGLIPQRMALVSALARTDKNFAVGLKEAIAAAGAMAGAGTAGPMGALPGLSLAGSIHASQSPRVANSLYKLGGTLDEESVIRDAIKRLLLQGGFSDSTQAP